MVQYKVPSLNYLTNVEFIQNITDLIAENGTAKSELEECFQICFESRW